MDAFGAKEENKKMKNVIVFCKKYLLESIFVIIYCAFLLSICFISNKYLLNKLNSILIGNQITSILVFMFTIGYIPLLIAIKQKYILLKNIKIKKQILLTSIISIIIFYITMLLAILLTFIVYLFLRKSIGDVYLYKHFNIVLLIYLISILPYIIIRRPEIPNAL